MSQQSSMSERPSAPERQFQPEELARRFGVSIDQAHEILEEAGDSREQAAEAADRLRAGAGAESAGATARAEEDTYD